MRACALAWIVLCPAAAAETGDDGNRAAAEQADAGAPQLVKQASGSVRVNYFRSDNQLNDKADFVGATLNLKLSLELGSTVNAKVDLRATNPDIARRGTAAASVTEGYIAFRADRFRARIGKQIVAWGRTDGINPTDNLTPRDYVALLPFEEDQRFGTTALTVDASLSDDMSLSLFTTPFFEPSKIPLPAGKVVYVDQIPSHRLSNSEFAARLNNAGGRVDWSASYFRGYSLIPDLRPLGFESNVPLLALTYPRTEVFGADLAFNLGRYGIRAEAAYNRMRDQDPADSYSRKSYWYYVVGGDRAFDGNVNVNLQLFGRFVPNHQSSESILDPNVRAVATQNAILSGQQDKRSYGVTARISKTWLNETLKAELLTVVNCTRYNVYFRPLLTYDSSDRVKLSVGANIFRGADDTFFGRLKNNSGIFTEARYAY